MKNGLGDEELIELLGLLPVHAPFLVQLLKYLHGMVQHCGNKIVCPSDWKGFICALSSASPVCALVHPSHKLFDLLSQIAKSGRPTDMESMQYLQQQCPVLFQLLRSVNTVPQPILAMILPELIKKAKAPFEAATELLNLPVDTEEDAELAYFPSLPKVRSRGFYQADKAKVTKACNKYSSTHPSLLPGIFTLFCQHGRPWNFPW